MVIGAVLLLYFNVGLFLNIDRLKWALDKFDLFKTYSWDSGEIKWTNEGWFRKNLEIDFKNFCFDYRKETLQIKGCLSKIYFNTDLSLSPPFISYRSPLIVASDLIEMTKEEAKEDTSSGEDTMLDLKKYYSYVWNPSIPELEIEIKKVDLHILKRQLSFPLEVMKRKDHIKITSKPLKIMAIKESLQLILDENTKVPLKDYDWEFKKAILSLSIKDTITLSLLSTLEFIELSFSSKIPSIINTGQIEKVTSTFLDNFKLYLHAPQVQHHLKRLVKPPYNSLPAPLNEMDGDISFKFAFSSLENHQYQGEGEFKVDFKSNNQTLNLALIPKVKVSAKDFSYSDIMVNLLFHDVLLELPRFSKRSLPPQMLPDSRFKMSKENGKMKKKGEAPLLVDLDIKGEEETSLHLKTDLIDEVIRLNFHFEIENNEFANGYVRLLPLSLKILKRPIKIDRLWVQFPKLSSPRLNSIIWFNLPEYKIKLVLEGPVESPRYVFTSDPPLPQSDIYSVLLFGRPLQDVGGDNTAVAQQTSQLISQGLLSLSVLYILSGTPIEYIGYDPKSKEATAQVGLGDKNSLRVSTGEEGRTTGVRRSLGRGWYLDTSVQSPSGASSQKTRDYGLFLERIISY